jgi:GT2 family glycosyltransferase
MLDSPGCIDPVKMVISIVSWNTKELLRTCLASLRQHCRPGHTRVVVIDNASSDGTPDMVRAEFPEVTLVESGGNLGFGKAHNLVAQYSTEPYVLFLNPDTEFVEPAHERMLSICEHNPNVALVGCKMTNLDGSVQPLGVQTPTSPWSEFLSGILSSERTQPLARRLLPYHDPAQDGFVRKLYGGCLLARREVLDQVGWFDERFFMYGEDVDLSRRIESAGYALYYVASTRIIHLCGGASAKAPGRFAILMQCESIAKLMEKYYGRFGRSRYVAALFTRASTRLTILALARLGSPLFGAPRREALVGAWRKNLAILRWTFRLDRPAIPQ